MSEQFFFRVQEPGISLAAMQDWNSSDGGDGGGDGLCAIETIESPPRFGGAWDALFDCGEVVVLQGEKLCRIYDGVRIRPTAVVARHSAAEWTEMVADGSAYQYE